ncbi:MAG: pimeloyl-ACP methyl ester esterase BioH [Alcanivoracaceae bacterium]|nr:pimeloyl-ACP methyl ester esterase BioH [Alcanivoracaceae bacterium]
MTALVPFHNTYRCTAADADAAQDLVLLHGWGLHAIAFDDIMPALLAHFRVTVIDLPGMGQSPLPAGDYDLDFLCAQIAPLLPDRCHLLGWSLGGLLALSLAERLPAQVQSVVTVATNPRFVQADDWAAAMPVDILAKFREVFDEDVEGTLIRFLALNCKGADTMRDDVRKLKEILYFCGLPARRALAGGLDILASADLRQTLAALQQPTLMLFGEKDNIVPAAVAVDVQALNPAVTIAVQQGVAHVPFISAPDIFVTALMDFYRDNGVVDA